MHSGLKMPLINHSLKIKSVPWMREHNEWCMQASGIRDSQLSLSTDSGLPSPLKTADMKPRQQVHDKLWGIMLLVNVLPALQQ